MDDDEDKDGEARMITQLHGEMQKRKVEMMTIRKINWSLSMVTQ